LVTYETVATKIRISKTRNDEKKSKEDGKWQTVVTYLRSAVAEREAVNGRRGGHNDDSDDVATFGKLQNGY